MGGEETMVSEDAGAAERACGHGKLYTRVIAVSMTFL